LFVLHALGGPGFGPFQVQAGIFRASSIYREGDLFDHAATAQADPRRCSSKSGISPMGRRRSTVPARVCDALQIVRHHRARHLVCAAMVAISYARAIRSIPQADCSADGPRDHQGTARSRFASLGGRESRGARADFLRIRVPRRFPDLPKKKSRMPVVTTRNPMGGPPRVYTRPLSHQF